MLPPQSLLSACFSKRLYHPSDTDDAWWGRGNMERSYAHKFIGWIMSHYPAPHSRMSSICKPLHSISSLFPHPSPGFDLHKVRPGLQKSPPTTRTAPFRSIPLTEARVLLLHAHLVPLLCAGYPGIHKPSQTFPFPR